MLALFVVMQDRYCRQHSLTMILAVAYTFLRIIVACTEAGVNALRCARSRGVQIIGSVRQEGDEHGSNVAWIPGDDTG